MAELIISVSGLRGVIGSSLTPDIAMRYAAAFASRLPNGPIVVSRDGRVSGPMLRDLIVASLAATGREVIDIGIAATPTVGVFVKAVGAAGAIQISASHNPPEYNGIKLFGADGRVIGAREGASVRDTFDASQFKWASYDRLGRVARDPDPHAPHLELVLATVDIEAIRSKRYRVLIDSNHGAGSLLGTRLLEELGCEIIPLGSAPDGQFEHPPEPTAENLESVGHQVLRYSCDIGFCQDPDADRLAIIDASGKYIGEEYTVALCMMRRLMQLDATDRAGNVVVNCATSGMTKWLAQKHGVRCLNSAVGEANVCDKMLSESAIYGGEGNGGPIDPRVVFVRDSFVGMAQVLDLMSVTGRGVSDLVAEIPAFHIHKSKVSMSTEHLPVVFEQLERKFSDAAADRQDGLRLDWNDQWLLVRGSNTEPIVRLIAEAPTAGQAEQLCVIAAETVERVLKTT